MKILLNCSTLMKGGALQVALSVFAEAIKDNEVKWYFAVTRTLFSKFEELLGDSLKNERIILLDKSPARSIAARNQLKDIVKQQDFDAVFTLFGPAYVKFPVPHLCGIADGWVTHSNKTAYQLLNSIKEKIHTFLLCNYKLWWYKKADKWCVEAQVAKDGFLAKTKVAADSVVVIANAVNPMIQHYAPIKIKRNLADSINIFCLGADYWHKNYQIVPDILSHLKQKTNKKINFIFTLPEDSSVYLKLIDKAKKMQVDQYILNLGPLALHEVVNAYQKYDILFFPSVLETFSITPLEALYMNMPMIISNIPANKQVIGEHAHYVDPLDSAGIAEKFINVIDNYNQEVNKLHELKAQSYFDNLFTATKRFNTYKSILKTMIA
jgi:glycosyltransferase involved in cell wall biosynthesis